MKQRYVFFLSILILGSLLTAGATRPQSTPPPPAQEAPPTVNLNPTSLDFGEQVTKKPTTPKRITVTNTGMKTLYINSVVVSEENAEDFIVSQDTCTGKEVAAQKSCVIDVVFTPSVNEHRKARVVLTNNAADSPQSVALVGVGINSVAVPPSKSGNRE